MKKLALILVVAVTALTACTKEKPEVGGTGAEKVANEWWVRLTVEGNDIYKLGHFKMATYNTASSKDSIWIDDLKHGYGFKSKAKVDLSNLTFGAANVQNTYYDPAKPANFPLTVSVTNGKVLPGAGLSKTGNVTDSIYLEVEFSDDPGTKYVMSGHARTQFAEDEY